MKKSLIFIFLISLSLSFLPNIGCATYCTEKGVFETDNYFSSEEPGIGKKNRLAQDLAMESLVYPLFHVWFNFASFRFLWDHEDFPFAGLANTFLDVVAVVPGYSHVDKRFEYMFPAPSSSKPSSSKPQDTEVWIRVK